MKTWNKPQATEIKMDAEISSYQDDNYDPSPHGPYGPEFATNEAAETVAAPAPVPRA